MIGRADAMKFRKGNKIYYGQDFRYRRGVPSGINFQVSKWKMGFVLRADGYGLFGNYGNGALFLYNSRLSKILKERLQKKCGRECRP